MNKLSIRAVLIAAAPLVAGVCATSAQAGAFYLQEQSIRGAGRAFSGEGADTGAASLWWNPAAIGGMTGGSAALGLSYIKPSGDVNNVGSRIVRPGQAPAAISGTQNVKDPINNGVLPSGAIAYGVTPGLAFGVAVTSPFSFTTNYGPTDWTRYTADKTRLRTIDIQPSIAFAPSPMFSIGAALNVEHADATLSNKLPNLSPLLTDGQQTLDGKGWDIGWSAGGQLHAGPLSVGLSYKSSIRHKLKGDVVTSGLISVPGVPLANNNATVGATATVRTPWQAIGSVRFKATDKLTLNGQIVRVGWNKFDAIRLGAPLNTAIPENYRNTWSYAGGIDYDVTPVLTLRAGIQHDQTPTRNGQRDARVPDSDRWNFTGGGSYAIGQAFTIDAAFGYISFKDATIDRPTAAYAGTAIQTPILVNGRVENAKALVFSLGGRVTF